MGKQNIKEENNNMDASKPSTQNFNGVIISVYVESPKTQSPLMRTVPVKKTKPKPVSKKPQTARNQVEYSDRRAQLLAYARELRSSTTAASTDHPQDQIQLPRNNLKAKPKEKWEWIMAPASICCPSRRRLERARRRWRYERVPVEENAEKADHTVVSESIGAGKKREGTTRRSSRNSHSFLNKLRCRLRELSC
ncbi:hypothetical protein F2P56_035116 [Juglans regia]|uniref:Uncharacterized protein n=1 Tax=Juglans regia TaxID=51240 RepID=A0A833WS27_JUGRE|nr:hypothetical protein F2P56_035116 [Juglans regia]